MATFTYLLWHLLVCIAIRTDWDPFYQQCHNSKFTCSANWLTENWLDRCHKFLLRSIFSCCTFQSVLVPVVFGFHFFWFPLCLLLFWSSVCTRRGFSGWLLSEQESERKWSDFKFKFERKYLTLKVGLKKFQKSNFSQKLWWRFSLRKFLVDPLNPHLGPLRPYNVKKRQITFLNLFFTERTKK